MYGALMVFVILFGAGSVISMVGTGMSSDDSIGVSRRGKRLWRWGFLCSVCAVSFFGHWAASVYYLGSG